MHTRQTKSPTYSRAFVEHVLSAYQSNPAAALMVNPAVGLWIDPGFNPTTESVKADFDAAKATFDGYDFSGSFTAGTVSIGGGGKAVQAIANWNLIADPVTTPNFVLGYWVEDDNRVVAFEAFSGDEAVAMENTGDSLILEVLLPMLYNQPVG